MKAAVRILVILLMVICHFVTTEISMWSYAVLYLVIALLSVLAIIAFWKSGEPLRISIPEFLLIGFVSFLFLNNGIKGSLFGNERLLNYLILLLLYFAFVMLYQTDKDILKFIFYGLLAGLITELIIGFGQLFGIIPNSDTKFLLGGLFGNPSAFAGYLAIVFPFLLVIIFLYKELYKSENLLYTTVLSLFCAASLVILCNSRGAWIASFIGPTLVLNHKYKFFNYLKCLLKTTTSKLLTGVVLLSVVIFISIALYHYKEESAFGRVFIWKVSKTMVRENPLFGKGYASFEAGYGKVQATYFLNNLPSESEIQVADYVTSAYNEFLEMLIESGIIGLLLFGTILYFALVKRYDETSSKYQIAAKGSLIALIVLGLVSYPFKLMPNLLLFVIFLFIIFRTGQYKAITISRFRKPIVSIWLLAILGLVCGSSSLVYGNYHFRKGYERVLNNDFENGITEYKKAYSFLNNSGEYLFYYGSALYLKYDYSGSVHFLQKAVALVSDPNAFITLGNSLQQLKRYPEAEHAYQMASAITPAKLYPKYLLAKLYIEMQQTGKALKMAELIINTKEKVPTTAGSEIKAEMKVLINQYRNLSVKPLKPVPMSP